MQIVMQNHHYIPELYLKGFLGNFEKLTEIDKQLLTVKIKPIKKICALKDFFKLEGAENLKFDGQDVDELLMEKELASLESDVAKILNKLLQGEDLALLSTEECKYLLTWICWLMVANPNNLKYYLNEDLKTNTQIISAFISWHEKLSPIFFARDWMLMISDNYIVTSDNPVCLKQKLNSPKDIAGLSHNEILFPISKKHAIIGRPNINRSFQIYHSKHMNDHESLFINKTIYENANRYVICSEKSMIKKNNFPIN